MPTVRMARAEAVVHLGEKIAELLSRTGVVSKGNVVETARIAGIMAAKRTPDLIPLCHPIALTHVSIDFDLDPDASAIRCQARAETRGPTGVEMEALTGASVAALTVYDMLKAVDRAMDIGGLRVTLKDGGKSGRFEAE